MFFFDSIDRKELKKMLEIRVADGSLLRLIGKCLQLGVLDGAELSAPEIGTARGAVLSPLLGNVHSALRARPLVRDRGEAAAAGQGHPDPLADFVIGFEHEEDARRVLAVFGKRLSRFGLTLHPDKTRLLPFWRPPAGQKSGKGLASFDFLGFTLYWARSRRGRWGMVCKTRRVSLRRAIQSVTKWCRTYRHLPVKVQHAALTRRLRGHFNYFGVSGNFRSLLLLVEATRRAWYKWLCRRSQRKRLTWERFADLLDQHPLPRPRITVRIWGP